VHRAAHHHDAADLIWVYDIHLIASRLTAGEWGRFVELAVERKVSGLCARGLQLAVDAFHTVVPDAARDCLSHDGGETSAIFLRRDLRGVDRLAADLRAVGPRRAPRLLVEHLFPPASYIREKYRVHRALVPAVYAYRILAGAAGWMRRPRSRDMASRGDRT
jgi:hypothetical protein